MNQKTLAIFFSTLVLQSTNASDSVLRYAMKQGLAQGSLLLKAKKISTLVKDPLLPEKTKEGLLLSQELLQFAEKIPMKTGAAYRKYVELENDWVTQVVIAAEREQLKLKSFEFPVVGSFPYKGFFDEDDAIDEEQSLSKSYDVFRRKVPAFSSLGWFSDPLTSNLVHNEYVLIETLFHELVHLNFYFDNYSDFNEAFATWFSYKASEAFAAQSKKLQDSEKFQKDLAASLAYDREINSFIEEIKSTGDVFYSKKPPLAKRQEYFSWIEDCAKKYPALKNFEKIKWNNAAVLSFSTYARLIPSIETYAQTHKLTYVDLLKLVLEKGSAVAKEVEIIKVAETPRRCASSIP